MGMLLDVDERDFQAALLDIGSIRSPGGRGRMAPMIARPAETL